MGLHAPDLKSRPFDRILLIKPSALGDVIHTVPVLARLRQRYPHARIDWMLTPGIAEWIGHHPGISNVIPFERRALSHPLRAWSSLTKLLWQLREARYQMVIDLHGQFRSAAFTLATGAPVRIGFDRPRSRTRKAGRALPAHAFIHGWTGAREFSWIAYSHRIPIPTLDIHAVDRYLWLSEMLGLPAGDVDFSVPIPVTSVQRVNQLLAEQNVGDQPLLLMAPGTQWETKRWHSEGYAAVARDYLSRDWAVVLMGSGGDAQACDEVARDAPGVVNLCGMTSVSELAALIQRGDLCISNDSGPMHMAVALHCPVVSIWGPTDDIWIGPYGHPASVVRKALPCSPCYLRELKDCPYGHRCMREIAADEVLQRAQEIVRENRGSNAPVAGASGRRLSVLARN